MKLPKRLGVVLVALVIFFGVAFSALYLARDMESEVLGEEARKQAPGAFLQLTDGMTHYQLAGPDSGQVVVLVHGFSAPSFIWDGTFEALARAGFRTLRYDMYGRGFSDRPDIVYERDLYERQFLDLLGKLNLSVPLDLTGASMGGAVVTGFAARHPEKVRKLVLIAPVHESFETPPVPEVVASYVMTVKYVPDLPESQLTDFYRPERFSNWADRCREQMKYKGFKHALASTVYHFLSENHLENYKRVAKLDIPVLLIWGRGDQTLPFSGSEVVREVLNPKFVAVEEAGHLPHLEQAELVNAEIISFLENAR